MLIQIAIDMHGGDHGLKTTIPACLMALEKFDDIFLVMVGQTKLIEEHLKKHAKFQSLTHQFSIHHADQIIQMDEELISALKHKKKSSMRYTIKLVKDKTCEACVSAGNSGALMAISRAILKTISGIDRPAMFARLPTKNKKDTYMLDLGANIDSDAKTLLNFAIMGSIVVEHTQHISKPRIGLLNIGSEEIKGKQVIKDAAQLLKESNLNYQGFIEADNIYTKPVDVVVCDGFEGNLVLKASEGIANMINSYLKSAFYQTLWNKISAFMARPALKIFKDSLDPRHYNGASLLGLTGIVIKSHGGADSLSFLYAITEARIEASSHITQKIQTEISQQIANINIQHS